MTHGTTTRPRDATPKQVSAGDAGLWTRDDWQWAVIASALPVCLCARKLRLDLWYDEVYTLLHFASRPMSQIATDYSAPNNHIFYTLWLRPIYRLSSEPFVLRLSSLAITVATLFALYHLTRKLIDRTAAVAAVLVLGLNIMFLVHTMQLRGYGLSMLLVTLLADLAYSPTMNRIRSFGIALAGAAFLYTLPTNLLFLLPLAAWSLAERYRAAARGTSFVRESLPWLAAGLLAALCYLPVLDQLRSHQPATRASLTQLAQLVGDVYWAAGHDLWPLLLVCLAVLVMRRRWVHINTLAPVLRGEDREKAKRQANHPHPDPLPKGEGVSSAAFNRIAVSPALALCLLILAGPFVIAAALGMTPFVRNFCPLLPFLSLGVGWLVREAISPPSGSAQNISRRSAKQTAAAALVVVVLLLPSVLLYPSRLAAYRREHVAQDGYYNYYAADFEPSCVAQFLTRELKPAESYAIAFAKGDHYNLVYHLARAGFPIPPVNLATGDRSPRGYVYVVLPDNADLARASLAEIAADYGIPLAELEKFTPLETCGYYQILRSPQPRPLAR